MKFLRSILFTVALTACGSSEKPQQASLVTQLPSFEIVGYWVADCVKWDSTGSLREYWAFGKSRYIRSELYFEQSDSCQDIHSVRDRTYGSYQVLLESIGSSSPSIHPFNMTILDVRRTYLRTLEPNFRGFGYSNWEQDVERSIAGRSLDNRPETAKPSKGEGVFQIISFLRAGTFVIGRLDEAQRPSAEELRTQTLDFTKNYYLDPGRGEDADLPEDGTLELGWTPDI